MREMKKILKELYVMSINIALSINLPVYMSMMVFAAYIVVAGTYACMCVYTNK